MEQRNEGVRKAVNWPEESTDERSGTGETTSLGGRERLVKSGLATSHSVQRNNYDTRI